MSSSIATHERELYGTVWGSISQRYNANSPGVYNVPAFLDMSGLGKDYRERLREKIIAGEHAQTRIVLDAGCGSGAGALVLADSGFDVRMCDLTADGLTDEAKRLPFTNVLLWEDLRHAAGYVRGGKVDYVYCCDVLEHIPVALTMLVVSRLLEIARHGIFLSIATGADNNGVWAGEPLHQTIESFVWWREHISTLGKIVEARDLLNRGLYYVEPFRAE